MNLIRTKPVRPTVVAFCRSASGFCGHFRLTLGRRVPRPTDGSPTAREQVRWPEEVRGEGSGRSCGHTANGMNMLAVTQLCGQCNRALTIRKQML
jgi:hypothetical protein